MKLNFFFSFIPHPFSQKEGCERYWQQLVSGKTPCPAGFSRESPRSRWRKGSTKTRFTVRVRASSVGYIEQLSIGDLNPGRPFLAKA